MFLTHFKFTSQPFAERLSAEALWQDDRMQQGLSRLRYVAEHATVALVTGASGVGKWRCSSDSCTSHPDPRGTRCTCT